MHATKMLRVPNAHGKAQLVRGPPKTGRGGKLGLYLSKSDLAILGISPTADGRLPKGTPDKIYRLIQTSGDMAGLVVLHLNAEDLSAIGAADETAAAAILMQTVRTITAKKRGKS